MTELPDRDRAIEQLLRQVRPVPASDVSPCVDAERLAAWAEGTLRPAEVTRIEQHLADCGDCQAMLAVFADSEAAATPAMVPFWRRWGLRWLVPAAAASAVLLVWMATPREPADRERPAGTMARAEQPAETVQPAPAGGMADDMGDAGGRAEPGSADGLRAEPSDVTERRAAPPDEASAQVELLRRGGAAGIATRAQASALPTARMGEPPPSPPTPAISAAADPAPAAVAVPTARSTPGPDAAEPAAPQLPAAAEALASAARANDVVALLTHARLDGTGPAHFAAPIPAAPTLTLRARDTRVREFSQDAEPPRPPVFWRIDTKGRVQRSIGDRGSWNEVALGDEVFIVAGSAPVAGVCWLVDGGGAVFRSTDAVEFVRTAFDGPVQLVAVEAIDASRATVTAADGRRFATDDAGATWEPGS